MFSVFLALFMRAILCFMQKKFEDDVPVIIAENKAGLKVKLAFNVTLTETHSGSQQPPDCSDPSELSKIRYKAGPLCSASTNDEDIPSSGTTATSK